MSYYRFSLDYSDGAYSTLDWGGYRHRYEMSDEKWEAWQKFCREGAKWQNLFTGAENFREDQDVVVRIEDDGTYKVVPK